MIIKIFNKFKALIYFINLIIHKNYDYITVIPKFALNIIAILIAKKNSNLHHINFTNINSLINDLEKTYDYFGSLIYVKNYENIQDIYQLNKCFNKNTLYLRKKNKLIKSSLNKLKTNKPILPDYYNNNARDFLCIRGYNFKYYGVFSQKKLRKNISKNNIKIIHFPIDEIFGDLENKFTLLELICIVVNLEGVVDLKKYTVFEISKKFKNVKSYKNYKCLS